MTITVVVNKVNGGFSVSVLENGHGDDALEAVASTPKQAGLRAGELCRNLIEAEFVPVANK